MNDFWIKIAIGVIAGAFGFLFRIYFGHSKSINKNSQDITELKVSNKYIIKTMDSITETIKDQHAQDRELMSQLLDKIK